VIVLGNKSDVGRDEDATGGSGERQVSTEEGIEFAKAHEVPFFEVSALENLNIEEAMGFLAKRVYETHLVVQK
jgi:hypothetical protein